MARNPRTPIGLETKSSNEAQLNVKISDEVMANLKALEKRISERHPDKTFNRAAVVEEALQSAIKKVGKALDDLEKDPASSTE